MLYRYRWKENSMLTNCLAGCAHLTITVPQIERDIDRKSSFFHTHHFIRRPREGGSPRISAIPFGTEKLEWLGYQMLKKFRRYLYSFWRNSRTWQTDRHTPRAVNSRAMHSIVWQKPRIFEEELNVSCTLVAISFWLLSRAVLLVGAQPGYSPCGQKW